MATETSPSAGELRAELDAKGVEFLFAQFVDMHGKPNAKLVPIAHLDGAARGRRRVRGLRRRRHRPGPARPGHRGDARPALAHAPAVEAGDRAVRLRHHRRGRAVAVLPADDPAQPARARRRARLRVQDGLRARVLPDPPQPRRLDRAGRRARHARPALLRHARADAQPRLRDRRRAQRQRARLGHLRDRPRGRERPVRAELPVRRRAHDLRPRDLLPLHGRVARAGARADGDVHAQAVRAPDRQRLPLPHEPVGRRHERLRDRRRPARARVEQAGLPLHRRPDGARAGLHRRDRADGELLQAAQGRRPALGRDLGAGLRLLRVQQPHADAARARARPRRGPHGRRLLQPVPRGHRPARRGPGRDRARARVPRPERDEPLRVDARAARPSSGSTRCPRTCSTPPARSSATT